MSEVVKILSVTANTPVEIYYCDSSSGSCVYVSTVSIFPYEFVVPEPYSNGPFLVKIKDTENFEYGEIVQITPTPTVSSTPPVTPTVSSTPANTPTPSVTPTLTVTPTITNTITPSITPTITTTPVVYTHLIGQNTFINSGSTCVDVLSIQNYYTYLADGPISIGTIVYTTNFNGVLYNPYNGMDKYIRMVWGSDTYEVQINSFGQILNFNIC